MRHALAVCGLSMLCIMLLPGLSGISIAVALLLTVPMKHVLYVSSKLMTETSAVEVTPTEVRRRAFKSAKSGTIIVVFSGIDGSGKSTQAHILLDYFARLNLRVRLVWGRWPAFLSYFALFVGKLLGLNTRVRTAKGCVTTTPHYQSLKILAEVYFILMFVDTLLKYAVSIARTDVVIFDRFVPDILADLILATGKRVSTQDFLARLYLSIADRSDLTLIFDLDARDALTRKLDVSVEELQAKRKEFRRLAQLTKAVVLDASKPVSALSDEISHLLVGSIGRCVIKA